MDDLLQEFVSETRETLEALAGEIVAWESNPTDRARLDAIFRFVHTVKGSCGFLDLPRLARLSHAAEDVLAAVRDGARVPDTALVNAVLAIVDRIGELVEAIDAGVALDDSSEDLLIAALAEDAAPIAQAAQPSFQRGASRSIRLNVDLLDRMMSGMSDMVLARNELARRMRDAAPDPQSEAALERLSATVAEMRDTVTRTRMQRIEALFAALPRMVRDTAADVGKQVLLSIDGGDVELDREMIELLRDPLVHIVRNSIDHGIEAPGNRRAIGKSEAGRLSISARQSGNQIVVEVGDDGAGIDVARIVAKAIQAGLCSEAEAAAMSDAARLELIFAPGLSSRDAVTALSGRGVGMDVVRSNIEQIGGRVSLTNTPGRGLSIAINVPLTLSIISTVVVGVEEQRFALPRQAIEEIVSTRNDTVRLDRIGDAAIAAVRGERLPLVSLAAVLGVADRLPAMLMIVATRLGRYALGIDTVLDTEELVIKPAAPAVMGSGIYAGQTLPDSGLPMLLLDAAGVAAAAGLSFVEGVQEQDDAAPVEEETAVLALMFDDLDGRRRAVALATVDRVETVPAAAIQPSGERMYLTVNGELLPLHLVGTVDPGLDASVLRLTDGERDIGYVIAEPIDIVALPASISPVPGDGFTAGIAMIDEMPVELIDVHALFAAQEIAPAARPLCLLHADGEGWMAGFLKPALEAAGYRCVTRVPAGQRAVLALAMDDASPPDDLPTIRLRRDRGGSDGSIYRYDREAVVAALADTLAGGRLIAGGSR
ncbi:chemotaxis protein CheA [Sphingomonas bacterium]|uniref:chemotaxis protein CheA n=1 Tax=Sphingomonas bacterium TaxID=1895847 RepID=UPI0015764AD8|nr:Hpt domain-containing protein [Sphingomonas bacterium]